jgi:hypothetical protein
MYRLWTLSHPPARQNQLLLVGLFLRNKKRLLNPSNPGDHLQTIPGVISSLYPKPPAPLLSYGCKNIDGHPRESLAQALDNPFYILYTLE